MLERRLEDGPEVVKMSHSPDEAARTQIEELQTHVDKVTEAVVDLKLEVSEVNSLQQKAEPKLAEQQRKVEEADLKMINNGGGTLGSLISSTVGS